MSLKAFVCCSRYLEGLDNATDTSLYNENFHSLRLKPYMDIKKKETLRQESGNKHNIKEGKKKVRFANKVSVYCLALAAIYEINLAGK